MIRFFVLLFLGSGFVPALANDKLLARLEKLRVEIDGISQVPDEAGPSLETLKRMMAAEALKIRSSKQLANTLEENTDLLDLGEASLERVRDQLSESAVQLREINKLIESIEDILAKTRAEIEEQAAGVNAVRAEIEETAEGQQVKELEERLARAEALVAGQSATIRKLQAGGTGTTPPPSVSKPAAELAPVTIEGAFTQLQAGDVDNAQASFERLLVNDPSLDDAGIGLASCAFARGEMARARALLDPLLEANAENPRALGLQGALLCDGGKFKEARKILEKAVELDPANPYYFNYLGVALRELKKHMAAVEAIQRAVDLDPLYLGARFNLALVLATARRPDLETARLHYEQYRALGGVKNSYLESLLSAENAEEDDL